MKRGASGGWGGVLVTAVAFWATACGSGAGRAPSTSAHAVILFLGDAGGLPTLNAAAIEAGRPEQLFVEHMPQLGLVDTSSASDWVTDSAAAMTAIVTGHKTRNGVLSQSEEAIPGRGDGRSLETVLEYAESHGLSTGVVTNSPATDATPAACYAHVNDRGNTAEIVRQLFHPQQGDGVDVVIGTGARDIRKAAAASGIDFDAEARRRGYQVAPSVAEVPADARRAIVLLDDDDFDLAKAADLARRTLSRNPRGYFLMVESDLHADEPARAFRRVIAFDGLIERTVRETAPDTLVIFTADHSFDLRMVRGPKGHSLLEKPPNGRDSALEETTSGAHAGEEVLVGAAGPGSQRVHGFLPNTQLFHVMMSAFGWERSTGPDR